MTSDADRHFMALAVEAAAQSRDRSRKVGCVIVGQDDRPMSIACNNFPEGVDDKVEARLERPEKYLWVEHAERNAIYKAARGGVALDGCRIYVPWYPCMDCARALIQSGIVEMICFPPDFTDPQWGEQFKRVARLLQEGGVSIRHFTP